MSDQNAEVNDGRSDFDFFIGKWKIHNRRLKERLKGCLEWEEFEGECEDRKVLDGLGNVDTGVFQRNGGVLYGMTVRLFDPKTKEWRLYWADSVAAQRLELPMVGKFKDGVGEFYAHEPFEGRMVYTRFIWSGITATSSTGNRPFRKMAGGPGRQTGRWIRKGSTINCHGMKKTLRVASLKTLRVLLRWSG